MVHRSKTSRDLKTKTRFHSVFVHLERDKDKGYVDITFITAKSPTDVNPGADGPTNHYANWYQTVVLTRPFVPNKGRHAKESSNTHITQTQTSISSPPVSKFPTCTLATRQAARVPALSHKRPALRATQRATPTRHSVHSVGHKNDGNRVALLYLPIRFVLSNLVKENSVGLVDTGSALSILPFHLVPKHATILPSNIKLSNADGSNIKVHGEATIEIDTGSCKKSLRRLFTINFVIAEINNIILGLDFLNKNNLMIDVNARTLLDKETGRQMSLESKRSNRLNLIVDNLEEFPQKVQEVV